MPGVRAMLMLADREEISRGLAEPKPSFQHGVERHDSGP